MNKLKKIIIGTVLTTMVVTMSVHAWEIKTFSDSLTVYFNGENVYENNNEYHPLIINDRTMVPLRPIFETMGMEDRMDYDDEKKSASFSDGNISCVFMNEEAVAFSTDEQGNQNMHMLDVPAMIYKGHFYIPIRAFCELWGMDIKWDDSIRSVYIESNTQNKTTKTTPKPTEKPSPTTKPAVTDVPVVTENPTINTSDTADFDLTYEAALNQAKMFLESQGASDDMSINGNKKPVKHNGEWAYEFELTSKTLDLNYVKKILLYIYEGDHYETEEVK